MWYLHDGWSVDGTHGGGEGSVEGVVEYGRADVGHDGVQQRLTQVLFVGGHGRGRGRRLKGQETQTEAQTGVDPLKIRNERRRSPYHRHVVLQLLQSDLTFLQRLQGTPIGQRSGKGGQEV